MTPVSRRFVRSSVKEVLSKEDAISHSWQTEGTYIHARSQHKSVSLAV
jgi:hypothetical protein